MAVDDLIEAATLADEASFVDPLKVAPGGVDPLGLRQINFDLMDRILPGLNNVAGHIRPFTVVTWAWRRARDLFQQVGSATVESDILADFVDRVEAIFVWSQFLRDRNADLPGSQALRPLIDSPAYEFGGPDWKALRTVRQYSTGLAAPINYGPALRSMFWIGFGEKPGVFKANPDLDEMLDAFETRISAKLDHPALSRFGPVAIDAPVVRELADLWSMEMLLPIERTMAFEALAGPRSPVGRQVGIRLIETSVRHLGDQANEETVRRIMADIPVPIAADGDLAKAARDWRNVQVRQVFRLALEAALRWILVALIDGPKDTRELANEFLAKALDNGPSLNTAELWRAKSVDPTQNPVDHLTALREELRTDSDGLPHAISESLLFCLSTPLADVGMQERPDRLPLWRARREFEAISSQPPLHWVTHLIEAWVIAQHLYWSVGRGLADARSGGKTLLRLRLTLEDGGWTLIDGASVGAPPEPTPDRLGTALSYLRECGRI